jgi:hypothetical protein
LGRLAVQLQGAATFWALPVPARSRTPTAATAMAAAAARMTKCARNAPRRAASFVARSARAHGTTRKSACPRTPCRAPWCLGCAPGAPGAPSRLASWAIRSSRRTRGAGSAHGGGRRPKAHVRRWRRPKRRAERNDIGNMRTRHTMRKLPRPSAAPCVSLACTAGARAGLGRPRVRSLRSKDVWFNKLSVCLLRQRSILRHKRRRCAQKQACATFVEFAPAHSARKMRRRSPPVNQRTCSVYSGRGR